MNVKEMLEYVDHENEVVSFTVVAEITTDFTDVKVTLDTDEKQILDLTIECDRYERDEEGAPPNEYAFATNNSTARDTTFENAADILDLLIQSLTDWRETLKKDNNRLVDRFDAFGIDVSEEVN